MVGPANTRQRDDLALPGAFDLSSGGRIAVERHVGPVVVVEADVVPDEPERRELAGFIEPHLDETNSALDPHERLAKVVVVTEPWTIENGLLTPTPKVKRSAVEALCEPRIEECYAAKPRVVWW
jgi:hypothetical protein